LLRIFTARDAGTSGLVGYVVYLVDRPLHHNVLVADQDSLFLSQRYRRGFAAKEMIRFTEGELKKDGVEFVTQHSSHHRSIANFLERAGYQPINTIFCKRLFSEVPLWDGVE
jgi:hypothetical protein